jgi:hypothetical protein
MARERSSDVSAAYRKLMKEETAGERLVKIWIWEYVLKFSCDEGLISELLNSLAFPDDVPRLKQMLLLKELSGQIIRGLVLQKALDTLERLLEVVSNVATKEAPEPPGPLLEEKGRQGRKRLRAPGGGTRILRTGSDGCGTTVGGGHGGDGQQERDWSDLVELIKEVRKELQDETDVESSVSRKRKYKEVENKLKTFIETAWTELGPIFLEKVEVAVMNGLYKGATGIQTEEVVLSQPTGASKPVEELADKEAKKKVVDKEVIQQKTRDLERARQGLLASVAQLEKLVEDPLPAALERLNENGVGDDSVQVPASTSGRGLQSAPAPSTRRKFLDPHPSAHSQRCNDDEIDDNPPTNSPSVTRQVQLTPLSSPQQMSPLVPMNRPKPAPSRGGMAYRQKNKWSEEEVETLKREVWKYGKGRWKLILQNNYNIFRDRTEVNLKDKWRNLERYEGIHEDKAVE